MLLRRSTLYICLWKGKVQNFLFLNPILFLLDMLCAKRKKQSKLTPELTELINLYIYIYIYIYLLTACASPLNKIHRLNLNLYVILTLREMPYPALC